MFERFTEKAISVILLAQKEAKRLDHGYIGPEQILLGLISEDNGIAFKALKSYGVNLQRARIDVERLIGRGNGAFPSDDEFFPFTIEAKQALELSVKEAGALGHNYIGTEHLLLGLIGGQRIGSAIQVLEKSGINLESLRAIVLYMLGGENMNLAIQTGHSSASESPKEIQKTVSDKIKVFIVHGHDELAKIECARFIDQIGLDPIILHEQASSGKTIIEKIEEYSNVGFGVVLYTPCDIGAKSSSNPTLKQRARQNVVFEHGFLIGKIGRNNVFALVKGEVEIPTDFSGVVYIQMDNLGAWKIQVAKEIRNLGYAIDLNKIM